MKKLKFICLCILLCVSFISYGQCPSGNIELLTQNDVDNFVANYPICDKIEGNLIIKGNSISDISGLSSLRVLKGHLKLIDTQIVDFTGLSFLVEIGGHYTEIVGNYNLSLIKLENLTKFDSYLSINGNYNLTSIVGFESLTEMKSIEFAYNYNLVIMPLFDNIVKLENFSISENESLVSFLGFSELKCISDGFQIHGNDILENIPKFNKLKNVSGFSFNIGWNPYLKDILGFERLEYVNGALIISYNGSRNSNMPISGFRSLREINGNLLLQVGITKINGFNKLEKVPGGILIENTRVNEIVGFEKLKESGDIEIREHVFDLTKINAFKNLEVINGKLNFYNNRVLSSISGFGKLKKTTWELHIGANFELTNLDFLKNLMSVGGWLSISSNTNLIDCNGIATFLEYGSLPSRIDIYDNPNKCSSQSEIIINADRDKDGVVNSVDLDDDNDGIYDSLEDNGNNDVDGDLIPNSLDLNSDNDACFDVNEAGLEDGDNDGIVGDFSVVVNSNGLVTNVNSAYLPPNDINTDGVYDFLDFNFSPIIITEPVSQVAVINDIVNYNVVTQNSDKFQWEISYDEGQSWNDLINNLNFSGVETNTLVINNTTLVLDNTFFRVKISNTLSSCNNQVISNEVFLKVENSNADPGLNTTLSFCPNDNSINLFEAINGTPDSGGYWVPELNGGGNIFSPSVDSDGVYKYFLETSNCSRVYSEVKILIENNIAGLDGDLLICKTSSSVDLLVSLGGSPNLGGVWTPSLSSGTEIFDPSIDNSGSYTYTVANGVCGSVSSKVDVTVLDVPISGLDGDLLICKSSNPVDLLASLGGSPDLGGVWTPSLSSGTGVFDPDVDNSDSYIYTVTNGVCGSVSSKVDVTVVEAPVSGLNGDLSICKSSSSVDLLVSLGGSPDLGGVWTPSLSSGTGIFDPSIDNSGSYTYTVANGVCGSVSSKVDVTVLDVPISGLDGDLSICKSSNPVDLLASLGGAPDLGGVWTPSLSSGTGVFDPDVDNSDSYIYTVTNGVCNSVSSKVDVTVMEAPVSGLDGSLSICKSSSSVDLLASLGGTPNLGGVWTPSLSSGSGIFDPNIDVSGNYTYTVTNGVCGSVSSKVLVNVFDEYEIVDYKFELIEFNNNNSITININQSGTYEYSLDGSDFRLENVFFNLAGGDYEVFVREINGCGRLNKKITLIDFPRFFTPNGDGINDVWRLNGTINKKYSVLIYDRFGKVLKELKNNHDFWKGNYLGKKMPSNDYWFQIIFEDGFVKTGNFSLLRN